MTDQKQLEAPEPEAATALRGTIAKILEKPLTVKDLKKVDKLSKLGIQMLQVLRDDSRELPGDGQDPWGQGVQDGDYEVRGAGVARPVGLPAFGGGNYETFSNTVLREIVAALPQLLNRQKQESTEDLVSACAMAKENGLPDVAAAIQRKIEAQLGLASGEQKSDADGPEEPKAAEVVAIRPGV